MKLVLKVRNVSSYGRDFTLKGIGEVQVKVPRDPKGEFKTQVIPRLNGTRMSFGKI